MAYLFQNSESPGFNDIQMMTIDNLPSQFPKEASESFANQLFPLLKDYLLYLGNKNKPSWRTNNVKVIENAMVMKDGIFKESFTFLDDLLKNTCHPK